MDPNPVVRWLFWNRLGALLRLADGAPARRVLDFGCGEGALLPSLSGAYEEICAIDLDPNAARAICERLALRNVTVATATPGRLPYPDAHFDLVFAADVLEHIPDLAPVLAELKRVLRPGGSLLVSAPTENLLYAAGRKVFGFQKPADHYRTAKDIARALAPSFSVRKRVFFPIDVTEALSAFVLIEASIPR